MEKKDPTKDAGRIPKRRSEGAVRAPKRGRIGNTDRQAAFAEDVRRRLPIEFQLLSEPITISRSYMPGYPTCNANRVPQIPRI